MDWIRLLRLLTAMPPSFAPPALATGLVAPEHHGGRRGKRRRRKRRKAFAILALVAAYLAGKCCGMKKRGCGSCGCGCGCASSKGCCCCKGGGGSCS